VISNFTVKRTFTLEPGTAHHSMTKLRVRTNVSIIQKRYWSKIDTIHTDLTIRICIGTDSTLAHKHKRFNKCVRIGKDKIREWNQCHHNGNSMGKDAMQAEMQ